MAGGFVAREQDLILARDPVEVVDDRGAINQHIAIVQDQGRDPDQGVHRLHLIRIAENRPGLVFERHLIQRQGDADTAGEGAVVLADQDHGIAGTALR